MAPNLITKGSSTSKESKDTYMGIRQDVCAWFLGMIFILLLMMTMMLAGGTRGWDANSGFSHNISNTSSDRFLPEPYIDEPGVPGRYGNGASGRWYYWQLPPETANALSRSVVWTCYVLHQCFIWGTIYCAQRVKSRGPRDQPKYSNQMTSLNWVPLFINVLFHVIHLTQTHWTYDATAQDVSEASSQASVIMLLVFVILMEYRDRGIFFGWPASSHKDKVSSKLRLSYGPINIIRKYHGYGFAWGAIYTFWYHPMENTWGHVLGFMHTWMLMLQGSLMYTNLHLNRYWRFILEVWVCLHGSVVAYQTGGPKLNGSLLWPMFCFGFLWLLTMTQLFGLPFWKKLPWWTRFFPFIAYLGVCIGIYGFVLQDSQGRYWVRMNEMIRIPFIEYMAFFFTWCIMWLLMVIEKKVYGCSRDKGKDPISIFREFIYVVASLLMYALCIIASFFIQEYDWKLDLTVLMVILVLMFSVLSLISMMLIKQAMKPLPNSKVNPIELKKDLGEMEHNGKTEMTNEVEIKGCNSDERRSIDSLERSEESSDRDENLSLNKRAGKDNESFEGEGEL